MEWAILFLLVSDSEAEMKLTFTNWISIVQVRDNLRRKRAITATTIFGRWRRHRAAFNLRHGPVPTSSYLTRRSKHVHSAPSAPMHHKRTARAPTVTAPVVFELRPKRMLLTTAYASQTHYAPTTHPPPPSRSKRGPKRIARPPRRHDDEPGSTIIKRPWDMMGSDARCPDVPIESRGGEARVMSRHSRERREYGRGR
jgi:hypothetical protein